MCSNTGFNSEQSDSTDSSMKESDFVKPAAKPSSNSDMGGFSLSNNHQIRYAFKKMLMLFEDADAIKTDNVLNSI